MFWRLVAAEQTKVWKRSMFWVVIALLSLLALIQGLSNYGSAVTRNTTAQAIGMNPEILQARALVAATWPGAFASLIGNVVQMGWLAAIVVVGATVAQEYAWRTLHLWLSRGVPRVRLLAAKVTALSLPLVAMIVIPVAIGSLVAAGVSFSLVGSLRLASLDAGRLALGLLAAGYSILPYAAVAFLLAVIGRSSVAAIGGGVAFVVVDLALTLTGSRIAPYMPFALMSSLLGPNAGISRLPAAPELAVGESIMPQFLPAGAAALGVAAWTLTLVVAAILVFRRQDLAD